MKQIAKEISNNKNLDKNISKYATNLMSLYHRYSHIRLAMNYYNYYEVIADNKGDRNSVVRDLLDKLNTVIGSVIIPRKSNLERDEAVKTIDQIRNDIIATMQILTAYTDIFNIYEYVLNRVEYRFAHVHMPEHYSDEQYCKEIMRYLLAEQDNVIINMKIAEVIRQLPFRMTKSKFFEMVFNGLTLYQGNDKSSLDDFLYMIRTTAMLDIPKNFDTSYPDLFSIYKELKNTDFSDLKSEKYTDLHNKILYASAYLQEEVDLYVMLTELINDVYITLLSLPYAIADVDEMSICNHVITAVNQSFLEDTLDPLGDEVTDMLIKLEGRQEKVTQQYCSIEYVLDEIKEQHSDLVKKMGLEMIYHNLFCISKLSSGSLFVEINNESALSEIADGEYVDSMKQQMKNDLTKLFSENERMVNRAVMASIISDLPIFFNNINEIQDYIYQALAGCKDAAEKIACIEVIDELMNM